MSSDTKTLKAKCLCGKSNHEIVLKSSAIPLTGEMCHCNSCRRMTGTMCLTVAFLPEEYKPAPDALETMTAFSFSERITQYFCTTCGCHMLARCIRRADNIVSWDVMTGTLERIEEEVAWQHHDYLEDTVDGGFSDFLTSINGKKLGRWTGRNNESDNVPFPWTSPTRPMTTASTDDKLHAQCKCGGVDFWISRPTEQSAFVGKYWPENPPADVSHEPRPSERDTFYLRDNGTKYLAGLCSCDSCRLASGMEVTPWTFIPTMHITLDKDGKVPWKKDFGTLKEYQSSHDAWRYFCGKCGAIVFYDGEGREYIKDVALGILMAPEGAKAESWFGWRTRRLGYRDDAIPRAESLALAVEDGLREWEKVREGKDLSGMSRSGGAL